MQIQYHVPVDMKQEDMDAYLDKIMNVVNRRRDIYRLEQLQRALYEGEIRLENSKADLLRIHAQNQEVHIQKGGNGKYKPNRQEGAQVLAAKNNHEADKIFLDRVKVQIKAIEKKLGPTSTANSNAS